MYIQVLKKSLDSDFKTAVKLKSREARLDAFCKETGRTKLLERGSIVGYNKSISGKAVGVAFRHYRQFAKDYNVIPEIKSLKEYYDLKANNPREFSWLKEYTRSVDKGLISPLVGFDVFRSIAREVDKELVGLKTTDGLDIKGFVPHFVTRLIGQTADAYPNKRQGVTVAEAKVALLGVAMPDKRRLHGELSRKYIGGGVLATVNPDKGLLIQTNHKRM